MPDQTPAPPSAASSFAAHVAALPRRERRAFERGLRLPAKSGTPREVARQLAVRLLDAAKEPAQ